jgi:hypothetical protein
VPSVRGDTDDVSLRIREHAERHAGHTLGRLDRLAAELLGTCERRLDVLDTNEEQNGIDAALKGPDRSREGSVDPVSTKV